jgi:uncharacterized protein
MAGSSRSGSLGLKSLIGYIVGGGLKDAFRARLTVPAQDVQEGAFVVIENSNWRYYGLVTDIQLGATDPRFADEQSEARLPAAVARALHGQTLFTNLEILPALMQDIGPDQSSPEYGAWRQANPEDPAPLAVKTVPPHHSPVELAQPQHIAGIFGKPSDRNFVIGRTREQDHPVCIDLEKFVRRSSGIFGATGTGKSFLTRAVLAGLIHYDKASVLVFDMHNEYALDGLDENGKRVAGLKGKFPARVRLAGLGRGAKIRGTGADFNLEIAEADIATSDIELLARELDLKETTATTLEALWNSFKDAWFSEFKGMTQEQITTEEGKRVPANGSVAAWANANGVNEKAAEALHNKLRRLFHKDYISARPAADSLKEIISALENGQHIVLSFGGFDDDLDYLFVTNLLTRRIRQAWVARSEAFQKDNKLEPRPLVIVVEEAHKLLNREMASQTAFAAIARELRKYYVTLLVIDQRPSQIYDEVMSQLGTRISGWLGDEDDIHAVLSGLAGREALRGMLARLQPKEEVLLLGWGVPMPLPVRSRRYNDEFWKELLGSSGKGRASEAQTMKELGYRK